MKTMVIDGKHYIQVKQSPLAPTKDCDVCAFNEVPCRSMALQAEEVFGGDCADNETFYQEVQP